MRRLLRLAAALLVAVASGDTAPPPEEPEPMASSNTLGGEFIVAAAAAPEPDAEEVDAAGEAAAAFEARRAALSEAMAPPDDYDASGEDDAVLEEMIREQEAAAAAQARADAEAARDAETAKAAVAEAERADAAAAAAAAPEPEAAPEPPQRPATASRANANFRTSTEEIRHERRSDLPPATADRRAPERKPGAPPIAEGDTMARLEDLLAKGQADAAAEAAALEAQKARRKHDPAYEARRAQAWGELSPWERRRCDDEVDRVRKLADRGHYAVLGLRRSAPAAAVKQKYRQKALLVHPDKNPSPDAQLAFDALREAHEILGDEAKRRDYDRRMRRKAEVRRQRIVREVRAIVETAAEYVAYRSRDAPKLFYSAVAVAFLLV